MTPKQKNILFYAIMAVAVIASATLLCCAIDEVVETVAAVRYLWR